MRLWLIIPNTLATNKKNPRLKTFQTPAQAGVWFSKKGSIMSKKDYIAIAEIITRTVGPRERPLLVWALASYLAQDNPRFDRKRFYLACGL